MMNLWTEVQIRSIFSLKCYATYLHINRILSLTVHIRWEVVVFHLKGYLFLNRSATKNHHREKIQKRGYKWNKIITKCIFCYYLLREKTTTFPQYTYIFLKNSIEIQFTSSIPIIFRSITIPWKVSSEPENQETIILQNAPQNTKRGNKGECLCKYQGHILVCLSCLI